MAYSKQAKKRLRQTLRRTEINRGRRSRMRTYVRKVEQAIAGGNKAAAEVAFRDVEPILARMGQHGIVHRNSAARKISRLARRIGAMSA